MLHWVAQNLGTICICAIVLLLIGVALFSLLKDRRNGKSSCGSGRIFEGTPAVRVKRNNYK